MNHVVRGLLYISSPINLEDTGTDFFYSTMTGLLCISSQLIWRIPVLIFYMPVLKTGRIMLGVWHPSVHKLFHFRLTPPTVYI